MKAIAAMSENLVIGNKGTIPWHLPEDFKWFKSFTMDKTLIVGRNTFDTLPPLKNRDIVVLSNSITDAEVPKYIEANKHKGRSVRVINEIDLTKNPELKEAIVIGGAKTYAALLPLCDELYVTHVIGEFEGDTFMPDFDYLFPKSKVTADNKDFYIVKYSKI